MRVTFVQLVGQSECLAYTVFLCGYSSVTSDATAKRADMQRLGVIMYIYVLVMCRGLLHCGR